MPRKFGAEVIVDPESPVRHTLRSLPGEFSGLQLLCYEYTGFQFIDLWVDIGFDIAAEYKEAKQMDEGRR